MNFEPASGISFFQRYLTLWVLLCMAAGIAVGHFMSGLVTLLNGLTVSGISLPITVLIWIMIFPMMMKNMQIQPGREFLDRLWESSPQTV